MNKNIVEMYKKRSLPRADSRKTKRIKENGTTSNIEESEIYEPQVRLEDLYGVEEPASILSSIITSFVKNHQHTLFHAPYLVYGSKQLGKSSLVEAVASKFLELNFIRVELTSIAEEPKAVFKAILEEKGQRASSKPSILFLDDLDANQELLTTLANFVKNVLKNSRYTLIICSASPEIDNQSLRKFNFTYTIQLERPDKTARLNILKNLLEPLVDTITEQNLDVLATNTPSFKVKDIKDMLLIAGFMAIRYNNGIVNLSNYLSAIEEVKKNLGKGTYLVCEKPDVTWNQIGGLSHVREQFQGILRRLRNQGNRDDMNFSNIILHGPPGCGKTTIAKAMANEAGLNFISIKPSELFNKYLGETERNIRKVFDEAREHAPCMIYFDEFEALCGTRGFKDTGAQSIQTLLAEIDGFNSRGRCFILAATNMLDAIDPAMRRPGRLSNSIYIGPPDRDARLDILRKIINGKSWEVSKEVKLDEIADKTENFTGADLSYLFHRAECIAEKENIDYKKKSIISRKHIDAAMEDLKKQIKKNKNKLSEV